jgi:hypothetical protein
MKTILLSETRNNIITNYTFLKYDSGIYHLIINTKDKWVSYHRADNDCYDIDDVVIDIKGIEIPPQHLCVHNQDKFQISFYWIPFAMVK